MDKNNLKEILKAFDESQSVYLDLEEPGFHIKLKKHTTKPASSQAPQAPHKVEKVYVDDYDDDMDDEPEITASEPDEDGEIVKAPLVGVFYSSPSPDAQPYVKVGDNVEKGQTLCLIEAMKMMNEVKAPRDGVIKKVFVKNQAVLGFEDPLFLIGEA